ncbi:hypothetical protein [Plantibacter sp. YIM 135249]|jgi:transcriptional regulator with XRE-family HTH domain|uniref:hypothetical protein n=1 Tax=Plantibacter sp. YIM 135249 TaxID=3423918 RepID=UPI003D346C82
MMTAIIRDTMRKHGITGNELASRLGVTPGAVSQLLASEQDETIKLHSLRRALRAMSSDVHIESRAEPLPVYAPRPLSAAIGEALTSGDDILALRLLTLAGDELAQRPDWADDPAFELPPHHLLDPRWDTFMRAYLNNSLPARTTSRWPPPSRLAEPWFVSPYESLQRKARRSTPEYLSAYNIFIDENSLSRA